MNPEQELSPQSEALIRLAVAALSSPVRNTDLAVSQLVRYLSGVMPSGEVLAVESALVENSSLVTRLAKTFRILRTLQSQTWESLQQEALADPLMEEIRAEWIEVASESLITRHFPELTLANLCQIPKHDLLETRIAKGILACLQSEGLAPKRPELVAATRTRTDLPLLEGFAHENLDIQFSAEIDSSGTLIVNIILPTKDQAEGNTLFIAFEINRQWMGLGSSSLESGSATLNIQGFGSLVGLTEGQLPPELFSLRMNERPSVCALGALVVQSASHPFAEIESEPTIENGNVSVDIRLLPQSEELRRADAVELWFGTGGQVWQLLGCWPIPKIRDRKMTLTCPSPKPGLIGIAFPGVLKLALRH